MSELNDLREGNDIFRATIAGLGLKLTAANERADAAEASEEAQALKYPDAPCCACSYDTKTDVCSVHSPMLKAAEAERDRLRGIKDCLHVDDWSDAEVRYDATHDATNESEAKNDHAQQPYCKAN